MSQQEQQQQQLPQPAPAVVANGNNNNNAYKAFFIFSAVVIVLVVGSTIARWYNFGRIISTQQQQRNELAQRNYVPNVVVGLIVSVIGITILKSTSYGRSLRPDEFGAQSWSSIALRVVVAIAVAGLSIWMYNASDGQLFMGRGGSMRQRMGGSMGMGGTSSVF
jgi:uncharacterized membrane protein YgcG